MEEELEILLDKKTEEKDYRIFEDTITKKEYNIYLNSDVEHTDTYLEVYETLRKASKEDIINLHMNSYGGYLDTAVTFSRIMDSCKAKIVGYLDVACSAMGMIALHCDEIVIGKHSYFQAHNFKGGSQGSGRGMRDKQKFDDRYFPTLVKEVYKDFLTEDELEELPNDANIWLTADELAERLRGMGKLSKKGYQGLVRDTKKKNELGE